MLKNPVCFYNLSLARRRIVGFILFPRVLAQCEMKTALFRFWTHPIPTMITVMLQMAFFLFSSCICICIFIVVFVVRYEYEHFVLTNFNKKKYRIWLYSYDHLKTAQMKMQCRLILELVLYEFKLSHNTAKAIKNICCAKG